MASYSLAYRLGVRPWEHHARVAASDFASALDRERPPPGGRALDLGCGRGVHTAQLAERGWETVGIDAVPRAVEEARRRTTGPGATYVVGDVTDLASAGLGTFDLFLDVGCFQGLGATQRAAAGRGVTALARDGATVLMFAFGATRVRRLVEGVSQPEILSAFPGWELLDVRPAETAGLGWPMNRTSPRWYRLGLR